MKRRTFIAQALLAGIFSALVTGALAQEFPSRQLRLIVPYAPGGLVDAIGRLLAQKLSPGLGQPVIVENRAGGNTIIGSEAVVRAAPDGYTILLVSSAHAINPALFKVPYDTLKDFAPVGGVMSSDQLVVVHPSVKANNLREFLDLAKNMDGKLNYATSGNGSPGNLQGEMIKLVSGIKMQHIAFNGSTPALTSVIGGQVEVSIQSIASGIPHIKSGRLKAIAITGKNRNAALPEVATLTEGGLKDADVLNWNVLLAPAATPRPILDRLNSELAKVLSMTDVKATFAKDALDPWIMNPDQLAAMLKSEVEKFARIAKAANIKAE